MINIKKIKKLKALMGENSELEITYSGGGKFIIKVEAENGKLYRLADDDEFFTGGTWLYSEMEKFHKKGLKLMKNLKNEELFEKLLNFTDSLNDVVIKFGKEINVIVKESYLYNQLIYTFGDEEEQYVSSIRYANAKEGHKIIEELKEQLKRY